MGVGFQNTILKGVISVPRRAVKPRPCTVWTAYRYVAARRAVLLPLVGARWCSDGPEALVRATFGVSSIHRTRVKEYGGATGLPSLRSDTGVKFAGNCPVFGLGNAPKTRTCNLFPLCPLCYARRNIIEPFMRFERLIYGKTSGFDADRGRACPVRLLNAVGFRIVRRFAPPAWTPEGLAPTLDDMMKDFAGIYQRRDHLAAALAFVQRGIRRAKVSAKSPSSGTACGTNCMPPTARRRQTSTAPNSAGPNHARSTWGPWVPTSCLTSVPATLGAP